MDARTPDAERVVGRGLALQRREHGRFVEIFVWAYRCN